MNKTVNINLANVLFHIDEDAFNKMRRYLESVRRSFANTSGSDEILADIEARIAELFTEKLKDSRQVITNKEVEEVITIMGQPEDYMVDEDIFEDEPNQSAKAKSKRIKKLYRDPETKYVAGVSSGIAHYAGIDPLWIRLVWVLTTIFSGGGFILLYGLLWILIPEAGTTSEKLDMRGEDINISNIERKVKEGFDDVANRVKSVDYDEVGNKVKNGGKSFFDTIGSIIMFFFKIFGKFIGVILIIMGAATIIGMFIAMLTVGLFDAIHIPGVDFYSMVNATGTPAWLVSVFAFFAIGIPFFFLMYLGLKILVTNLKSIGNVAKFSLLGLWLISMTMLIVFGIQQGTARAYSDFTEEKEEIFLPVTTDTLNIGLVSHNNSNNSRRSFRLNGIKISKGDSGEEVMVIEDVRVTLEASKDSTTQIEILKESRGPSFDKANEFAGQINYKYTVEGNTIYFNDYLTTARKNKIMDQGVRVKLSIPVGTVLNYYDAKSRRCRSLTFTSDDANNACDLDDFSWKMQKNGELKCQDCPEQSFDYQDEDAENRNKVRIDEEGIDININDEKGESVKVKIDENGIDIKAKEQDENNNDDSFEMKIDENGVKIKN